jgi:predicted nucleotidyltransferase
MRYHQPLDDILGNRVQVKILRILVRSRASYTGRELARMIGYSQNQTSLALKELERHGLVVWQSAGRSHLYSIDSDNIVVNELLENAFRLEDDLLARVADVYKKELGKDLVSVILFGSIAKKEERPNSDIDLVLVFRDGTNLKAVEDHVAEASARVASEFGNQANPISVNNSEYEKKKRSRSGLWQDVAQIGMNILNTSEGGR